MGKQPSFNYQNKTNGIYCATHKLKDMIGVKNKKCYFENCNKQPQFNYQNKTNGIYCVKHKLNEMIDVKNKKCCFVNVINNHYLIIKIKQTEYNVQNIN